MIRRETTVRLTLALLGAGLLTGCATMEKVTQGVTAAAAAGGVITEDQAASINKTGAAVGKTFEDITPEQEYYIGRSVAATIMQTYKPFDREAVNRYVNELGQTLALFADRPETFGGYHFLVVDTAEVNAFAAPGGLILVSRGLLRCCRSEDALAAVLAHEIGHVQLEHGLRAIKKGRLTGALTVLATESAKNLGGEQLAQVTAAFEGSISDITQTIVNSGYARKLEFQADEVAVRILSSAGYNPTALKDMLLEMKQRMPADGHGFAKTHPDPQDRVEAIAATLGGQGPVQMPAARQARFTAALQGT